VKSLYQYLNDRHYKGFVKKMRNADLNPDHNLIWHEDNTFTPVNPDADKWQTWKGKMELRRLARKNQPWWLKTYRYVRVYFFGLNGLLSYTLRPRTIVNKVTWYHQRATRGWADCDVWSMDSRMSKVMSEMLEYLADRTHAYPGTPPFETPEKWDAHLRDLSRRFKTWNDDTWCETKSFETTKGAWADFAEHFGYYWD
jgi:hypothetical protein